MPSTAMASSSMSSTTVQSISDILVDIYNSTDGIRSLSISSPPPLFQFGSNVANLPLALHTLSDDDFDENLLESLKSLNDYLKRIHATIGPHLSVQFLDDFARGLGRCIGLVAEAWVHAPEDARSKLGFLHREMLKGVIFEGEIVEVSAEEEPVVVDVVGEEVLDLEGLAAKVKTAEDGEALIKTLMELEVLIRNGLVETEDEESVGVVVSALVGRLGGVREEGRIKILMLLKMLATKNALYEVSSISYFLLLLIFCELQKHEISQNMQICLNSQNFHPSDIVLNS